MTPLILAAAGLFLLSKRQTVAGVATQQRDPIYAGASDGAAPPNVLGVETEGSDVDISSFLTHLQLQPGSVARLDTDGRFTSDDISVKPVVEALQQLAWR